LSKALGVPLNSQQAQALMDANQAMVEGGGYTASEVSFRLACMRVLNTLRNRFSIKSWRVLDESDETRNRYVQASMLLSIGDKTLR
jgi:2-isopropylmalate synthase